MCSGSCNTDEVTPEEILESIAEILEPKIRSIKVEQFGVYSILLNFQEVTALQIDLRAALSNSNSSDSSKQSSEVTKQ